MKTGSDHPQTQGLADIRQQLGLSQQLMAYQLGISRSLVSRAEKYNRSLPAAALQKLAALEKRMATADIVVTRFSLPKTDISNKNGIITAKKFNTAEEAKLEVLTVKLSQMKERYQQLQQQLADLMAMKQAGEGSAELAPALLELQHYKLLRKLHHCNIPAQQKLEHKIYLLTADIMLAQAR